MHLAKTNKQDVIRNGWSDEEREGRRELAEAMQLQLRTLIVLSDRMRARQETEERPMASASGC